MSYFWLIVKKNVLLEIVKRNFYVEKLLYKKDILTYNKSVEPLNK